MLISGKELHDLIDLGIISASHDNVNATSIDVTLDTTVMVENVLEPSVVNLSANESPNFMEIKIGQDGMLIQPSQCFLGNTKEYLKLPNNISAEFITRSSMGRCFLEHMKSGWIDAGFSGQITLEMVNMLQASSLLINDGLRVGQIVFYKHDEVPEQQSYATKGNYNGQIGPTPAFSRNRF